LFAALYKDSLYDRFVSVIFLAAVSLPPGRVNTGGMSEAKRAKCARPLVSFDST
jgi:hypothetical protein